MAQMPEIILTARLRLRPLRLADVREVFEYAKDPAWALFLPVPQPYEERHAEEFIAGRILAPWHESPHWALECEGAVVGGQGLRIDAQHRRAEIGYSLAPRLWGRGLTTEAAGAIIDAAFQEAELEKIVCRADVRNLASIRVMEKLGMRREGTLRRNRLHRGEFVDDAVYGLLREEWRPRSG